MIVYVIQFTEMFLLIFVLIKKFIVNLCFVDRASLYNLVNKSN